MDEAVDAKESKPDLMNLFQDSDFADNMAKYNKYEADYVRRIKAKYFSKKALNGVNIFDEETTIDKEVVKSSRWPCTKPFIDPVQSSVEQSKSLASAAETSSNVPNRKYPYKKSS